MVGKITFISRSLFRLGKILYFCSRYGDLAHLVERQVRNLKVAGSSPVISTESKRKPLSSAAFVVSLPFDLRPRRFHSSTEL